MSIEHFPEALSQGILVGIILVGRLGARSARSARPSGPRRASPWAAGTSPLIVCVFLCLCFMFLVIILFVCFCVSRAAGISPASVAHCQNGPSSE